MALPLDPGARSGWSPDVSVRVVLPYVDLLREHMGDARLEAFLVSRGVERRVLQDKGAWVTVGFMEAVVERAGEVAGDLQVKEAARSVVGDAYGGPLATMVRYLGSPGALYTRLPELLPRLNKRTSIEVLPGDVPSSVRVVYRGAEQLRLMCTLRAAQLEVVPSLWGLPDATVTHERCYHDGHEACVYEVHWTPSHPPLGAALGLLLGLGCATLAWWFDLGVVAPPAVGLAGLLVGLLVDRSRALSETRAYAQDQHRALQEMLHASEERFNQVQQEATRRRSAERAHRDLETRVRDTDRLVNLGLLSGRVVRGLNNALNIVTGNLEYLQSRLAFLQVPEAEPTAEVGSALVEAVEGAHRIQRIVGQLVRVSEPGETEILDLAAAVEDALAVVPGELESRLVRDYRPAGPVQVDGTELQRLLLNLVVQTMRAVPDGDSVQVRVHGDSPGWTTVELGTEGWEMSLDAEICHALEVCGDLVCSLGGSMVLQGDTLRMVLPRVEEERVDLTGEGEALRIVIADDERMIVRVLGRFLAGHEVRGCTSAAEVLGLLDQGDLDWDLLLVDVAMPHMDGLALHRTLRDRFPDIAEKVVFMTGGVFALEERAYLSSVSNRCIDKPVGREVLEQLLAEAARRAA